LGGFAEAAEEDTECGDAGAAEGGLARDAAGN
jgi:hypothetical protein